MRTEIHMVENEKGNGYTAQFEGDVMTMAQMIGRAIAEICDKIPPAARLLFQSRLTECYKKEVENCAKASANSGCEDP